MAKKGRRGKQNAPPAHNRRGWTEDDVFRIMVNPFSVIEIHPHLTVPHEAIVSEDQWIAVNTRLIRDYGAPRCPQRRLREQQRGNPVRLRPPRRGRRRQGLVRVRERRGRRPARRLRRPPDR